MKNIDEKNGFDSNNWSLGWKVVPDNSINKKLLFHHYSQNPDRWAKAFSFLKDNDLESIATGTYEIEGKNVFANIEEYITKNEDDTEYEAHRKYADIQYLAKRTERIGLADINDVTVTTAYIAADDIALYKSNTDKYLTASGNVFFIFFPTDAHRPCVKLHDNTPVKKIVIKINLGDSI